MHEGVTAVITGAGGGLGRTTALRLAGQGVAVACADVNAAGLAETVDLVRAAGGRATSREVDITSETDVTDWRAEVVADLGAPRWVLNIAGVLDRRMLADLDHQSFVKALEINAGGTYLVTRTFAGDLKAAGSSGRVVNVASIAAVTGYPYPGYAASKAAVLNLGRTLLHDFWGTGVTINTVCPGAMDTPMIKREAIPLMVEKTPVGRVATPDDVAAAIEFFCSDGAGCINGASLVVDGGATAAFRYFDV